MQEYFLFDPLDEYLEPRLQGFRLVNEVYQPIDLALDGTLYSQELNLLLEAEGRQLRLIDPNSGETLPSAEEAAQRAEEATERAKQASERAEAAVARAEAEVERRQQAEARAVELEQEVTELRRQINARNRH